MRAGAASSPIPSPMPATRPSADADQPTTNASSTTDHTTWPPVAPIARSSPSSRVRWVTRIVKVLKMMNAPTTTPIAANPSKRVGEEAEELRGPACRPACVACRAVRTSKAGTERALDALLQHRVAERRDRAARRCASSAARASNSRLRGREVEGGERHRAEVGAVTEPEEADDPELLARRR